MMPDKKNMKCGHCEKRGESLSTCSGCLAQFYCSPQCQKANWKTHKRACKPFKIQEVQGKGFGMLAIRDIKQGELILMEEPTLVISKTESKRNAKELMKQYEGLDETKKASIMSLHDDCPTGPEDQKLRRIFENNGIDVNSQQAAALYLSIPRINHSCAANVVWGYCEKKPLAKEVRALRPIRKGEELLANYIDSWEASFLPHTERQKRLRKWKFDCTCTVCSLPSQQLTNNDRIRCEICRQHQQVPQFMSKWDVKSALEAAEKKLKLSLEIKDEILTSLPASYLEVFEIASIYKITGGKSKVSTESYLAEAENLSKSFGYSFYVGFQNKVKDIKEEIRQIIKSNPQILSK
eukprot:TRINITY_DN12959_c0_g1_i2.p1 TRINITY_DN12959_c0_g1~~TRINITY_DN12959_c0_g1_i2.p1  ORF type:complete len:351 (+),score=48.42 TRINITY_DN12959_c0_g1_i2:35-1087(+)